MESFSTNISFASVWKNFLDFIKNPRLNPLPDSFLESPLKIFPYILGIDFLMMIPLTMLLGLVGVEEMDHKVIEMMDNPLFLGVMAVLIAPLLEETVFRLPIGFFKERWFKIAFWAFTLAFAFVHLTNFGKISWYLAPILVLPQFILGVLLGYIRVGWGFWYCVAFHALHNGILVGLASIGKVLGLE